MSQHKRGRHEDEQLHFLQTLIDRVPSPIFYKDLNGRYLGCNKAFEEYHGISREKILGLTVNDIINDSLQSSVHEKIDKEIIEQSGTKKYETSIRHPDGSERTVFIEKAAFTDLHGNVAGIVGIINDISELRTAEKEQMKVSKLESLGVLAGGIAHDFNNILTTILGNISLAKIYGCVNTEKLQQLLENAEGAISRAKELTQQLLTFSKGGSPLKKITSIQVLLRNTATFALTGSHIRCEFDIAPDLMTVDIDEIQISQVIGNIVLNAQQAMPHGGTIHIRAENVILGNSNRANKAGDFIRISIRDQGIGIPEENLDRIFDPYFTTKQTGSGLGLSICYSIIQKHNGHIGVESNLGVGTTLFIYLPVAKVQSAVIQDSDQSFAVNGNGRILVMDDEETIRDIIGDILRYLGYTVDFAKNGEEAISLYSRQTYDAVILDLTIPGGMGGKETIGYLHNLDPSIKAIVSSGYSNDPIMSDYEKYGFKGVIVKPYTIQEISQLLSNIISGSEGTKQIG